MRLREIVRVYGTSGMIPVESIVLFRDLGDGFMLHIPEAGATVTSGWAQLWEAGGRLHGEFTTEPKDVAGGREMRLEGFAFRIHLEASEIEPSEPIHSVSYFREYFRAFRALNTLLDLYRMSKFQANPGVTMKNLVMPWAWLDPGRPDVFTEFLTGSYAVFETDGQVTVEASLMPKMYQQSNLDISALRNAIKANQSTPPLPERQLLLDAWVSLYQGAVWSAIVLANTALETTVRRMLIEKIGSGDTARKRADDILKSTDFPTQLKSLLPMMGFDVSLSKEDAKLCQALREHRTGIVHKGRTGQDWHAAEELLLAAERIMRDLLKAEGKHTPLRVLEIAP